MFQATEQQAQLLADLCIGRLSDYALQTPDGRYRRAGLPVSLDVLQDHLNGFHTMGTYLIDEQGQCRFAVFDADQPDGLEVLAELWRTLGNEGIPAYLEASRRGGHLWIFLTAAAPAWAVRRWLLPYCPAGVEFYPKQDETNGYGSLIRVPLGVHQRSGYWYPFVARKGGQLHYVADTLDEMLSALAYVRRVPVPPEVLVSFHGEEEQVPTHTSQTTSVPLLPRAEYATISDWCAAQDPFEVIGRYVSLDGRGLGHCPFGEHHRNGEDRHPSFQVYQPKRPGGGCWRCYTGEVSGNVFNFLQLYHGLTAAALWAHLRTGQGL